MNAFFETLRNLGPARLAILGLVGAGTLVFFLFLGGRVASPSMSLLYSGLSPTDSSRIVARLEQLDVPYQLAADGNRIMVPGDQVARLRLAMAEQRLPSADSVGYEIFDRSDGLGTTNFVQTINHLRALEGELSRTIASLSQVAQARVHLVLPQRRLFSREREAPSASIVLSLSGGELDRPQVQAIQHMVAAAVPGLKPGLVSIVDDRGQLLAAGNDEGGETGVASNADDLRRGYERRMARTIETLLERSVGSGNVRAQVSAEMDFDRVTENAEIYDPEGQVVRSTQTVEETSSNRENQEADPVTVGANLPDVNLQGAEGPASQSQSQRVEETVNFEISRTVRTHVRESGAVRRLSIAVLVNGVTTTDANGEPVYQPRPQAEMDQLGALVRSAVGFDETRGDTLEIANLRFADLAAGADAGRPWDFMGLTQSAFLRVLELAVLGVVALLAMLFVIRPMMARLFDNADLPDEDTPQIAHRAGANALPRPAAGAAPADGQAALEGPQGAPQLGGGDTVSELERMIDIERVEGRVRASSIKKIGDIVDKHPEEAVAIIRNWLYEQA